MKVLLLLPSSYNKFTFGLLTNCLSNPNLEIVGCIVDSRKKKTVFRRVSDNIKKGRGGYVFIMLLKIIINKIFKIRESKYTLDLGESCENVYSCVDLYADKILSDIDKLNPDMIILVGGFGILKKPILSASRLGVYSFHHGDMRSYRGMPMAFWEIYNEEKQMGITFQRLDEKLDAGIPVAEDIIKFEKKSYSDIKNECYERSFIIFNDYIEMLVNGSGKTPIRLDKLGKLYTLPNLYQWLVFNYINIKRIWF